MGQYSEQQLIKCRNRKFQSVVSLLFFLAVQYNVAEAQAGKTDPEGTQAEQAADWTGLQIMEEIYRRHEQFPYVYEEQTMITVDRRGRRNSRQTSRYSRVEEDGTIKFLLLFKSPGEVKGVTLLATRDPSGVTKKAVYLPAFGETFVENTSDSSDENFLGTDFSIEDLTTEVLSDYYYDHEQDEELDGIAYFVVDVYLKADNTGLSQPLRRHFIRQDNFYIIKTDHYDKQGRISKRQTHHDLKKLDADMWRAGMILMEDLKEQHQSLIKINRRIFSKDYVPEEMFTEQWVYENYPALIDAEQSEEGADVIEGDSSEQEQAQLSEISNEERPAQ